MQRLLALFLATNLAKESLSDRMSSQRRLRNTDNIRRDTQSVDEVTSYITQVRTIFVLRCDF